MATSGTLDPATLVPPGVTGNVLSRAADVELAVFDVDGGLTEGALHYGPNGEETKVFNTLDGHGIKMLQSAGVVVAIISGRESKALGKRAGDLGIHHLYMGVADKGIKFQTLLDDDGASNGKLAPPAVYIYLIEYNCPEGGKRRKLGTITLIR